VLNGRGMPKVDLGSGGRHRGSESFVPTACNPRSCPSRLVTRLVGGGLDLVGIGGPPRIGPCDALRRPVPPRGLAVSA
jgi:hypothetical protein